MVASVATPEHPVSLPHYCETFFRPDVPLGGRRDDSLREQVPDYMEDVVERSISVSGWCPQCEQPRVNGRYPGKMSLMFAPFFSLVPDVPFRVLKVLFDYFFHNTITNVQYSRQLADSYPPVLPKTRSLFSPVMEVLGRRL